MTMMPDENMLAQSGGLVLTTHRIRVETQTQITSIMLEELCSCETRFASHSFLLTLAGLFAVFGLIITNLTGDESDFLWGVIFSVIFVAIYFATRKAVITLASAGARINLERKKTSLQEAKQLIDQIEAAKNQPYLLAHAAAADYSGVAAT